MKFDYPHQVLHRVHSTGGEGWSVEGCTPRLKMFLVGVSLGGGIGFCACSWETMAGMLQQQQMSGASTSWADRCRLLVNELELKKYTKSEVLDRVYVKGGLSPQQDGTKVDLPHLG